MVTQRDNTRHRPANPRHSRRTRMAPWQNILQYHLSRRHYSFFLRTLLTFPYTSERREM